MKIHPLEIERLIEASTRREHAGSSVATNVEATVLAAIAVYFVAVTVVWIFR